MAVLLRSTLLVALAAVLACGAAGASGRNWAAPQIKTVTKAGVLGTSPRDLRPPGAADPGGARRRSAATDAIQHPAAPPPTAPSPVTILSTVGANALVGGTVPLEIDVPGRPIDHVDLAVDGTETGTAVDAPYEFELDTTALADGVHQLAVNVGFEGGGFAIAVWQITVSNAAGSVPTPPGAPVAVP